ncbi:MAG: RNase adapter RapZ [Vicinamibacterales bacterium]
MTPAAPRPTRAHRVAAAPFVVVTGLSGAGKSHAIRALEDLGYFCVDNLPIALIPTFADLALTGRERRRAAVVVDVREGPALAEFPETYRRLKRRLRGKMRLVFLEAADGAILRRFSETRRPHPLAGRGGSVAGGLKEERRLLRPIRRLADTILDTTTLNVHELRRQMLEAAGGSDRRGPLAVTLMSFGYRHGVPPEADLVFDVRFLPNPHFVPSLRRWTGRSAKVASYVLKSAAATKFLSLTEALLRFLLPQYIAEGKSYLTIAIGCTGGRHRSVAIAAALGRRLAEVTGTKVRVRHRDVAES